MLAGLLALAGGPAAGQDGASTAAAPAPQPQAEMRTLHMRHHWLPEHLDVTYKIGGEYQPAALTEISHFMRDWHCNREIAIDPGLADRLYELQQSLGPGRTIRLISGYRSEGYNASLLAAGRIVDPNSQHMLGRAADVFVPGVPADRVKAAAEQQGHGGVGYYPFSGPRFVHVDTGPDRHWTETDPAVRRKLGLPNPARKAFKLDCALTMDQVVKAISPEKVFAALPQGAAVATPEHPAAILPSQVADREALCRSGEATPPPLLLLAPHVSPVVSGAVSPQPSDSQTR